MSYLDRLKARIAETATGDTSTELTQPGFVSYVGAPTWPISAATVSIVREAVAQSRLREWHARLSKIDEFISPPGWTLNQWLKTLDAACWLSESYASTAVRDGWSALDLFGVDLAKPGEGGLADRLGDKRVLIMAADAASWRSWGVAQIYYRDGGEGLVPLWEV